MAEFAPGFDDNVNRSVLPKNTQPLTSRRVTNALVGTTVGAAAGGATSASKGRVKHPAGNANFESKVPIETDTEINRASTAGDVTTMKTKFTRKKASFAIPRDLSGNGGPAFTRS